MRSGLKKNFIYNLMYQLLLLVTPLITTPYLSRTLGAELTGIYAYAYSVAKYFVLFAMLGLNNYGRREIARVQDERERYSRVFWQIYAMQFFTGAAATVFYILYCAFFNSLTVGWVMLFYVLTGVLDISWFYFGMEEFKSTMLRSCIIRVVACALILLFVKGKDDLLLYALIKAGSLFVEGFMLWLFLPCRVAWRRPSAKEVLSHIKPNLVLFLPVIAVSLYTMMDKIMLGAMSSYEEVGFYEYSEKVIQVPVSCINALGAVMLPRMSNIAAKSESGKEHSVIYRSMIFGVALTTAAAFGLMAVADVFVPLFYGSGYVRCVPLFYLLLPSCIFIAVGNVLRTQYLIPRGMDKALTVSLIGGAVVNLALNSLLIPAFSSVGAAVATLFAEGTVAVSQLWLLRRKLPVCSYIKETAYIVLCAAVMFAVVYFMPGFSFAPLTLAAKCLTGAVCFILLMLVRYRPLIKELLNSADKS